MTYNVNVHIRFMNASFLPFVFIFSVIKIKIDG